jgi:probable phosphoglycerate mutase
MAHPFEHRIIFVRHGQTSFNAEGRLQGQRDVPLDGKGREQAAAVGRHLRKAMTARIARLEESGAFWASPLVRARETMEIARVAMGLPPKPYSLDPRLKELSFGAWEGMTWAEIENADRGGATAREADKWRFTPPGGENYAALAARIGRWLEELSGDTFVVAHGGVARALFALIADMPVEQAANTPVWQGRALVFEDGGAAWVG